MLVVSDTSPLSNLAIIGRLELLREQFAEVWMPPAVARELGALGDSPAQVALLEAVRAGWLKEMPLPSSAPFPAELNDSMRVKRKPCGWPCRALPTAC